MDWHVLYRLYDDSGTLLYVGITRASVRGRIATHRRKPWGSTIATHTEQRVAGREAALRAEATAICDERPAHNIYQTERMPVRGRPSAYGRCGTCCSLRPLRNDGSLRQHWSANELCRGSGTAPEPLRRPSGTIHEALVPSRARADQGAGNKGAGVMDRESSGHHLLSGVQTARACVGLMNDGRSRGARP